MSENRKFTCMNCPNQVEKENMFCSENCEKQYFINSDKAFEDDLKKDFEKQNKEKRKKRVKKVAIIGLVLGFSLLMGVFFLPEYEIGEIKKEEKYPRTYNVNNCVVQYDLNMTTKGEVVYPKNMECDHALNGTEVKATLDKINSLGQDLNNEFAQKHPFISAK